MRVIQIEKERGRLKERVRTDGESAKSKRQ